MAELWGLEGSVSFFMRRSVYVSVLLVVEMSLSVFHIHVIMSFCLCFIAIKPHLC